MNQQLYEHVLRVRTEAFIRAQQPLDSAMTNADVAMLQALRDVAIALKTVLDRVALQQDERARDAASGRDAWIVIDGKRVKVKSWSVDWGQKQ